MTQSHLRLDIVRFLGWTAVILVATLLPFDFGSSGNQQQTLHTGAHEFLQLLDVVLNILLFAPFGLLLAITLRLRRLGPGLAMLAIGVAALSFSFFIELVQQWLQSRTSSAADVVSNTSGALIGAVIYLAWGRAVSARLDSLVVRTSPRTRIAILAAFSAVVLFFSGMLQYRARPSNWDEKYPLVVGNEHSGDRPWRGRVSTIEISDISMPEKQLRDFAASRSAAVPAGNITSIQFGSGGQFKDARGKLPPLVWVRTQQSRDSAGLPLTEHGWLESAHPPMEIAHRIAASGEFTLHLVCASDDVHQEGPGRIVSYSIDTMHRNFTVGQEGRDLVFRLRTPATDENGTRLPLIVPDVFSSNGERDILITYGGSTLRAAVAGSNQIHALEISPGVSLAGHYLFLEPQYFSYYRLAYYGTSFLSLLMLFAFLERRPLNYFGVGLCWVAAFAVSLEGVMALASPRAFDWNNLGICFATGFAVLVILAVAFGGGNVPGPSGT